MAQLSYVHGASSTPLIGETIGIHFDKLAERCGEGDALISRHQGIRWSYRALKERVDAFAAGQLSQIVPKPLISSIFSTLPGDFLAAERRFFPANREISRA